MRYVGYIKARRILMLAQEPVPVVDFTAVGGPIRCRRCRAYINPFNIFVDGGRKFVCKFCSCENEGIVSRHLQFLKSGSGGRIFQPT